MLTTKQKLGKPLICFVASILHSLCNIFGYNPRNYDYKLKDYQKVINDVVSEIGRKYDDKFPRA